MGLPSWNLHEGDDLTPGLTAMRLLGGGSSYEAYLAFDETTLSPVVVKVLRPDLVEDPDSLAALAREVDALARANHPVVVRALRHEADGPRPHLVLENIDGPRLSSLLRRHGRLSEQQYVPLAIDLAAALHFLGTVDLCHLDLKPSNVIMGAPARLIDLSVARPAQQAAALRAPIGTDAYMAPEQADPGSTGHPGPASDVWGLGATLFHAVAGYRPFEEGDPDASDVAAQFPQLVETPHPLPDGVPAEVATLLSAMLAPHPQDRPAPREVADALAPVLHAQPPARLTWRARS